MVAKQGFRKFLLGSSLLAGSASFLIFAAANAQDSEAFETVVVTGYRASLEKALELKRESVGVRDSIVAEDIGKYPASNIAESLARVPGVALSRDGGTDEGKTLTVRGLDASYTIVTINGNPVHMETGTSVGGNSRSVDLDALGADLFSRVDFYKSPQANLDEGGIGGVIDMRTPHPFDFDGFKANYSVGYSMNTNRDKAMPNGTVQVSDIWGSFGALFAMTFKESAYEIMGNDTSGWGQACNEEGTSSNSIHWNFGAGTSYSCGTSNYTGSGSTVYNGSYSIAQINQAFVPRWERNSLTLDDRTRYSGLLSLQYKYRDDLDVTLDVIGSLLSDKRDNYMLGVYFRSTSDIVPVNVNIDSNNNLYGTFANVDWQSGSTWVDTKDKFLSGTFNTKYQPIGHLTLNANASMSVSNGFYSSNAIAFYIYNQTTTYDPTASYKFPSLYATTDFTNVSAYSSPNFSASYWKEGDRVVTGKFDGEYDFESGLGFIGHVDLKSGISWVSTQKTNDYKTNASAVSSATLRNGETLASMSISDYAVDHIPVSNFLDGVRHGMRPTQWVSVPRSFYKYVGFNKILDGVTSNFSSLFNVTEAVESAFLQADTDGTIAGQVLKLSVGLRYAKTRLWGYNYATSKNSSGTTVYTKTSLNGSYDDYLPTVALTYNITDDLLLRAAYGKTITRPGLSYIAQSTTVSSRYNAAASSGNPNLKPLKADNFDMNVEWYFSSESMLSVGVFYKDLKNLISSKTDTVTFSSLNLPNSVLDSSTFGYTAGYIDPEMPMQLTSYTNLNPLNVKGVEVYYQQPFTFLPAPFDGLGAQVGFTYNSGAQSGTGTGFTANDDAVYKAQLVGMSTYTYSATAYYEKDAYSIRFSYNFRSKSPQSTSNYYNTNLRQWQQARGTLDMSLAYRINDYLDLRFDGSNILNSDSYSFLDDGTAGSSQIGSRYSGAGEGVSHNNGENVYGSTFMLSLRGRL